MPPLTNADLTNADMYGDTLTGATLTGGIPDRGVPRERHLGGVAGEAGDPSRPAGAWSTAVSIFRNRTGTSS